ncbi:MAG: DUF5357 family protein [Kovacikia sp.]
MNIVFEQNTISGQAFLAQIIPGLGALQIPVWLLILIPVGLLLFLATTSLLTFDIAKTILSTIKEVYEAIKKVLTPPKWDSWQILIWISAFSWFVSMLPSSPIIQSLIATSGWIFLIPGIHWLIHEEKLKTTANTEINVKKGLTFNNFFFGPWITGALTCLFLFGGLIDSPSSIGFLCWPPLSAMIALAPKCITASPDGPKYGFPEKAGDRQEIVILMLSNLILSCWFQLYFLTQTWIAAYPSLLSGDLSKSTVIVKLDSRDKPSSRGVAILEQAGAIVTNDLTGQSWSMAERWLLDLDQQIKLVEESAMNQLTEVEENTLWSLQGRTVPGSEYTLQMYAIWQGPTVDGKGYYLTKACQITRGPGTRITVNNQSNAPPIAGLARVECGEVQGPFPGQPDFSRVQIEPANRPRTREDNGGSSGSGGAGADRSW